MRRPRSQSTAGAVTEAMIAAVRTGITIVCVSERSQIAPTSAAAGADQEPGREAEVPQPLRSGEDPAQGAGLDLDDFVHRGRALARRTAHASPEESPLAHRPRGAYARRTTANTVGRDGVV